MVETVQRSLQFIVLMGILFTLVRIAEALERMSTCR